MFYTENYKLYDFIIFYCDIRDIRKSNWCSSVILDFEVVQTAIYYLIQNLNSFGENVSIISKLKILSSSFRNMWLHRLNEMTFCENSFSFSRNLVSVRFSTVFWRFVLSYLMSIQIFFLRLFVPLKEDLEIKIINLSVTLTVVFICKIIIKWRIGYYESTNRTAWPCPQKPVLQMQ